MRYDDLAKTYDLRYQRYAYSGVEGHLLGACEGATRVLEVGCGTGHWLELLTRAAHQVAGVDPSAQMLARAQARVPHAELVQGRAEALPFPDASFDRVICVNAFHHVEDKRAFLAEARRVLRPDGALWICGLDPHTGHERWWIYDYYAGALERDRARFPDSATQCRLAREAGFAHTSSEEVHRFASRHVARTALDQDLLAKSSTSQLALLSDAEYAAGIARLRHDIDAADARGEPLTLETELRLRATTARLT